MPKTKNLALELITDENTLFKEFREKLIGEGEGTESSPFSNMQIIDKEVGDLKEKLDNLKLDDVVTASIIDVDVLPTQDIKTNVFYRLNGVIYAYKNKWIELQNALNIGTTNSYDETSDEQIPTTKLVASLIAKLGGGGTGGGTGEGGIASAIIDVEELPSAELAAENVLYRTKTETFIGWFGESVPSGVQVENVYFNKQLSIEEVLQVITEAEIVYDENKYYVLKTENKAIIISNENDEIKITNNEGDVIYFDQTNGWNQDIDIVEINEETLTNYKNSLGLNIFYGDKNGSLSSVISSKFFEKGIEVVTHLHHFENGKRYDLQNDIEKELYDIWEILVGNELEEEYPKPTLEELNETKQDKLTPGAGVTITEDNVISVRPGLEFKIEQTLPATGDSTYIYLIPNNGSEQKNIYEEYVWVDNSRFELVGSTQIDLSPYYTKTETDSKLNSYYTKTQIDSKFNSYYIKSQIDNKFASYYTSSQTDAKYQTKLKPGYGITIESDGTINITLDVAEEGSY